MMRGILSVKFATISVALLLFGCSCISTAAAATPGQAMPAFLWINGLPQGEQVVVTVAGHVQLDYVGGQGRCDFSIAGQPGELIRVLAGGREVQIFTFAADAPAYLNLTYADGVITSGPYDPSVPMPTPRSAAASAPGPETERTRIGAFNSIFTIMAIVMAPVVVGICAIFRLGRR